MTTLVFLKLVFIFVLGSAIGSFLNVVVERGQRGEKIGGRSKCDFCGYRLSWMDNVPILSFLWLGGKCRKCKKKLSWQYPLMELSVGLLFVSLAASQGFFELYAGRKEVVLTFFFLVFGAILAGIFLWDLKYMIIPDELVVSGVIVGLGYLAYRSFLADCSLFELSCFPMKGILSGAIISLFFYLMFVFSKGKWIGGGDVKLGFLLGLFLEPKLVYPFFLLAYCLGAVVAVWLLAQKKKGMNSQIPFGPFLIVSCLVIVFFYESFIFWTNYLF